MHSSSRNSQSQGTIYRHGDVLLSAIAILPSGVQKRTGVTLASGEVTGHSHRIQQQDAVQLWVRGNELFLEVKEAARLIHEEHRAIELPQGVYRVWKQREYRPDAYVEVED
ncbi:hypothetical protein [Rivularia sp. UHCC 0363]|uniref:hypothetical protein n=1 Tax=Rivularia sp. UHCC 0363 TaxID=3110244 RepID=UPI002B1FCA6A|nr:hypothetical protein [Rivularia sp. UHCC 0363]MEA5595488.1 hypothetical protein [Rivularia sp. UHCC 0363]